MNVYHLNSKLYAGSDSSSSVRVGHDKLAVLGQRHLPEHLQRTQPISSRATHEEGQALGKGGQLLIPFPDDEPDVEVVEEESGKEYTEYEVFISCGENCNVKYKETDALSQWQ